MVSTVLRFCKTQQIGNFIRDQSNSLLVDNNGNLYELGLINSDYNSGVSLQAQKVSLGVHYKNEVAFVHEDVKD